MSAAELNALEREVELTRARFAGDLARLRSPHTFAEFKEDLWAHARDTKDGVLADVKARQPILLRWRRLQPGWRGASSTVLPSQRCWSA
jgi:hypothetical protein